VEERDLGTVTNLVKGMTRASCVRRVDRALSRHEVVSEARINFAAEKATVDYEPGTTSPEKLVEIIRSGVRRGRTGDGLRRGGDELRGPRGSCRGALEKVGTIVLKDHVEHCVRRAVEHSEDADMKIEELTAAVERFLRV